MDIEIQISGYVHDGEGWYENQPYARISATLTDPDNDRKCAREMARAVRAAGYYGRPVVPFGSLQEFETAMFRGSSLGLYWYPGD